MAPYQQMTPTNATLVGRSIWLNSTPPRNFAMVITHYVALDELDETSSLFTLHLRRYKSLWVQGVAVKTMQRYDEDRYGIELKVYQQMLAAYAGRAANVGQVQFKDF